MQWYIILQLIKHINFISCIWDKKSMFLVSDIDECTTGLYINECPTNSNCRNLDGSFSCGVAPVIDHKPQKPGT